MVLNVLAAMPVLANVSELCDRAAQVAARDSGVPLSVLRSITRTETGRNRNGQLEPWPWTVNMEGAGTWFDTEAEAHSYVDRHLQRGAQSFDVGCFQVNYKWHGEAFRSIREMFDPNANARYAATFLKTLHAELGDWAAAAGAYHSRTPDYARKYQARFERIRATLEDLPLTPALLPTASRARGVNSYPLLQAASTERSHGSLVPLGAGRGALFAMTGGS